MKTYSFEQFQQSSTVFMDFLSNKYSDEPKVLCSVQWYNDDWSSGFPEEYTSEDKVMDFYSDRVSAYDEDGRYREILNKLPNKAGGLETFLSLCLPEEFYAFVCQLTDGRLKFVGSIPDGMEIKAARAIGYVNPSNGFPYLRYQILCIKKS